MRAGALQRDQRAIELLDLAGSQARAQNRFVLSLARGVADDEQRVALTRDHQIVEDAAVLAGEKAITLAPGRKA